jgi:hypothetical protein
MAKMLRLLFDWEYPHWMMMAGAILVAAGFIGLAFHRNRNVETDQKKPGRERAKSYGPRGCAGIRVPRLSHEAVLDGVADRAARESIGGAYIGPGDLPLQHPPKIMFGIVLKTGNESRVST